MAKRSCMVGLHEWFVKAVNGGKYHLYFIDKRIPFVYGAQKKGFFSPKTIRC